MGICAVTHAPAPSIAQSNQKRFVR
jgi:hypothetical protein